MVDPIGSRTTPESGSVARVGRVVGSAPAAARQDVPATPIEAPGGLSRDLAAAPPVDADRIAAIKAAVADGRFPITPAKIADRLIALKMQWEASDAP